jgi:CHASE2 domain-containing sensor protein
MIEKLELVLRATMQNGDIVEGATTPVVPSICDVEDAHVFGALDKAACITGVTYHENLASVLTANLRRRPILDRWPSDKKEGQEVSDLIDLCLLRLCTKLHVRNDPPP